MKDNIRHEFKNLDQKVVLVITDGIGYKEKTEFNAFYKAKKPTYDKLFLEVPNSKISTYGLDVGLPSGVFGNSEVGHMSLGSGRVLYQDLVKINKAIESKQLDTNKILSRLLGYEVLHLAILLSDGGVHAHINHLLAILDIAKKSSTKIYLHLFTDGRDVLPKSALKLLALVEDKLDEKSMIASISGRYYAMDRDNRWDRIELAFNAINGSFKTDMTPREYILKSYGEGVFDEFIKPISFKGYEGFSKKRSGFLFLNYRSDRARQLISSIGAKDFNHFKKEELNLDIACMCEYDSSYSYDVLFPKDKVLNTLASVIADANLSQAHIAETEKYAHVTFFFNGGIEKEFKGEIRELLASPKVATYDLKPEMSAKEVTQSVLKHMNKGVDFIVVNFANGDMVGHTGNLKAAISAVECVDKQLKEIFSLAKKLDYAVVVTSDHGNCEEMGDESGNVFTNHTLGDVFCFIEAKKVKKIKNGSLSNIAPSVLKIMGLEIPKQMDVPLF